MQWTSKASPVVTGFGQGESSKLTATLNHERAAPKTARESASSGPGIRLDRLRLRGPNGARDEFHLAATAQNLRKLAKIIPMPAPALA